MVLLSFDCNNLLVKRTDGDRYDVRLPSGLLSVSFVSLEPSPLSSLILYHLHLLLTLFVVKGFLGEFVMVMM